MLTLDKISFSYRKNKVLFDDLSLTLQPGNIYGLLGKNGAGKTTLLRIMSGLLMPGSGSCQSSNGETRDRKVDFMADFFIVPEEFALPRIYIDDFVSIHAPFYPKFSQDDFQRYLREFEVDQTQRIHNLSFGQKKKVLLSFGLATGARLVLMDEPTNGLDIPAKSQFRKIIASSLTDDRCYVISTHQVRDLENLIDPIIILDQGRVVFNASTLDITRKLIFKRSSSSGEGLYSENIMGGYSNILPNSSGEDTHIDMELLFNGVINQREQFQQIFKN